MLGFDRGTFDKGGGVVRTDIIKTDALHLRMPSGMKLEQIGIGYQVDLQMAMYQKQY